MTAEALLRAEVWQRAAEGVARVMNDNRDAFDALAKLAKQVGHHDRCAARKFGSTPKVCTCVILRTAEVRPQKWMPCPPA